MEKIKYLMLFFLFGCKENKPEYTEKELQEAMNIVSIIADGREFGNDCTYIEFAPFEPFKLGTFEVNYIEFGTFDINTFNE